MRRTWWARSDEENAVLVLVAERLVVPLQDVTHDGRLEVVAGLFGSHLAILFELLVMVALQVKRENFDGASARDGLYEVGAFGIVGAENCLGVASRAGEEFKDDVVVLAGSRFAIRPSSLSPHLPFLSYVPLYSLLRLRVLFLRMLSVCRS